MSIIIGAKLNMKFFVIFLIGITFLTIPLNPQESSACSCIIQTPGEALEESAAIFSGTVTKITEKNPTWPVISGADPVIVEFQVDRVWKGPLEKTITVSTPRDGSACGYGFEMDKTYLVYSYEIRQDNPLVLDASLCSRTAPIVDASEDLSVLGIGKNPNEVEKTPPPHDPYTDDERLRLASEKVYGGLGITFFNDPMFEISIIITGIIIGAGSGIGLTYYWRKRK